MSVLLVRVGVGVFFDVLRRSAVLRRAQAGCSGFTDEAVAPRHPRRGGRRRHALVFYWRESVVAGSRGPTFPLCLHYDPSCIGPHVGWQMDFGIVTLWAGRGFVGRASSSVDRAYSLEHCSPEGASASRWVESSASPSNSSRSDAPFSGGRELRAPVESGG